MSGAAHTPGQLLVVESTVYAPDETDTINRITMLVQGGYVNAGERVAFGSVPVRTTEAECMATAERLAACWNALEGIPDPSVVGEAIEALRAITKDFENRCEVTIPYTAPEEYWVFRKATEALSKLEGKA